MGLYLKLIPRSEAPHSKRQIEQQLLALGLAPHPEGSSEFLLRSGTLALLDGAPGTTAWFATVRLSWTSDKADFAQLVEIAKQLQADLWFGECNLTLVAPDKLLACVGHRDLSEVLESMKSVNQSS